MLLVIFFHLETTRSGARVPILAGGWIGVDLFFVLSGFLITGILLDSKGEEHRVRNFYARRVLRIFPLYYLALAFVFFVVPRLELGEHLVYPASDRPYYFLYVQNVLLPMIRIGTSDPVVLGHTWSLAVEEQFYLVWPWLVFALPRRALTVGLGLLLVAVPFVRDQILSARPAAWSAYWLVYRHTLLHVDGLAAGCLLALAVRAPWARARGLGLACLALAAAALPVALWMIAKLAEAGVRRFPYEVSVPLAGTWLYTLLGLGFAGLVGAVLLLGGRGLDLALANAPLRFVGRISYGLYVWHLIVIELARTDDPLVLVAITFAAAIASWTLFERPFLRMKAYFGSART